jgi:RNA polymerase-associated protein CTR9
MLCTRLRKEKGTACLLASTHAGNLKAASKAYQELVQQFPGYIDCYLRLSALARAAGDMDKAREWADKATQQAGGDVDAEALLATLFLQRG